MHRHRRRFEVQEGGVDAAEVVQGVALACALRITLEASPAAGRAQRLRVASQMLGKISAAPARWYPAGASPSSSQALNAA